MAAKLRVRAHVFGVSARYVDGAAAVASENVEKNEHVVNRGEKLQLTARIQF